MLGSCRSKRRKDIGHLRDGVEGAGEKHALGGTVRQRSQNRFPRAL